MTREFVERIHISDTEQRGILNPDDNLKEWREHHNRYLCCGLNCFTEPHAVLCDNNPMKKKELDKGTETGRLEHEGGIMQEDPSMKRYFGVQPGGGLINIYHFEKDAFGVIGSRSIENIFNEIKRERKQSFNAVRAMLLGFKMVKGKQEKILSISCGVDPLGNEILVVVTQEGGGLE